MSRAERITPDPDAGAPKPRLHHLAGQVKPLALAAEMTLPVLPRLTALLPSGLRRGSTVVVTSASHRPQGAISLALALTAEASATGSWGGAIAFPDLGLLAAAELGIDMARLALIPDVPPAHWVHVVAAMVDSVDILLARPPAHLKPGDARRLTTRARERGAVLIPVLSGGGRGGPWAEGADVRLEVSAARWEGPGTGEGRLHGREITVIAGGRGAAARERVARLSLPPRPEPTATATAFAGSDADRIPDHLDQRPTRLSQSPDRLDQPPDRLDQRPDRTLRTAG